MKTKQTSKITAAKSVKTSSNKSAAKNSVIELQPAVAAWKSGIPVESDANNAYGVRNTSVLAEIFAAASRKTGVTFNEIAAIASGKNALDRGSKTKPQNLTRIMACLRAGKRASGFRGYSWPVTESDTRIVVGTPRAMASAKKSRKSA